MTNDKFLETLYQDLDGNIEIRELPKDKDDKKNKKRYFLKTIEELKNYIPPMDKHVYIGMYTRQGRNGTAASCLTTKVLWSDFDYKTIEEVKEIIKKMGLPPASILVDSGHGVHAYWVLHERAGDEAVNLIKAISLRTGADTASAEKARVLRLPGTFNVKNSPKKCKIAEFNNNKYTLEQFKEVLSKELSYMEQALKRTGNKEEITELKKCSRACIRLMAKGTTEGHRNFALCKIVKWLQLRGYTRKTALEVIRRWNTLNTPPKADKQLIIEFNKVWETDYRFLGCKFKNNKKLQDSSDFFCAKGECKYSTLQEITDITSDNSSNIDNLIFKDDVYPKIRGMDLAMYFTVSKTQGITKEHLSKIINTHVRNKNFIRALKYLTDLNLIKTIEGNKRVGEKDLLIINTLYNDGRGYTIVNNLLSECFLGGRVTDTEYKLLVLLKSYCYTEDKVYPTVVTLAAKIGKSERTVTSNLRSLERKLYIKNYYTKLERGQTKLSVKLLF